MGKERKIWASVIAACLAIVLAGFMVGSANDYTPPPGTGAEGTVTLPTPCTVESPCEPLPTPTEGVGFITPVPVGDALVLELPATGAGTTAREVRAANHTGWHYGTPYCESGWYWVRWDSYFYWTPGLGHYYSPGGRIVVLGGFCNPWS